MHKNRFPFSRFSSGHARNELANRTWPIVTCHSNFSNCFTIHRHPFRSIRGLIGHLRPPSPFFFRISFLPSSRVFVNRRISLIDTQLFRFERDTSSLANDDELKLLLLPLFESIVGGNLSRRHVNLPCFLSSPSPLITIHRSTIGIFTIFLQSIESETCFSSSFPKRMLVESKMDGTSAPSNTRAKRLLGGCILRGCKQDFKFRRDNRLTFRLSKEDVGDSRDSLTAGH